MEKTDILNTLTEIFKDVLDREDITLTEQTTANDIEEWDSLSHIQIVVAVEKRFKIRFVSQEIQNWKNVGEIVTSIQNKNPQ